MKTSLQEQWMPDGTCFGCGPANASGLRLRSFPSDEGVVAEWHPERHHNAYPGMLCGGVSAVGNVRVRRASAATGPDERAVILRARVVRLKDDQAIVEGSLEANGTTCATCSATWKPLKRR
jgi:hypothetical protein